MCSKSQLIIVYSLLSIGVGKEHLALLMCHNAERQYVQSYGFFNSCNWISVNIILSNIAAAQFYVLIDEQFAHGWIVNKLKMQIHEVPISSQDLCC